MSCNTRFVCWSCLVEDRCWAAGGGCADADTGSGVGTGGTGWSCSGDGDAESRWLRWGAAERRGRWDWCFVGIRTWIVPGSVPAYHAILEVELSHSIVHATCSVCLVGVLRERPSLSVRHVVLLERPSVVVSLHDSAGHDEFCYQVWPWLYDKRE